MNTNWSYSPETPNLGQIRHFLEPCDLEIWRMTLKNNRASLLCHFKLCVSFHTHWWSQKGGTDGQTDGRTDGQTERKCLSYSCLVAAKKNRAPLLCHFKLCASFRSHWWIQTGVTVRKPLIWVKIDTFLSRVTLKFDGWPSKTIGYLFYATSSFMYHFVAIGEFKLELESGNAQSGSNSTLFRAVWSWNLTDDLQKR